MSAEPVRVVPYDALWPELFRAEQARVRAAVGGWVCAIEHVGSTAVPGLDAKPIVDLMAGVRGLRDLWPCVEPLEGIGYESRGEAGVAGRIFLRKGDPRVFHLSLTVFGGEFWEDHLLFRDALRARPETAREYARLKHRLASSFRDDREAYAGGKTRFVEAVIRREGVRRG